MVQAVLGPMSSQANSSLMAVKSVQVKHKLCRKILRHTKTGWQWGGATHSIVSERHHIEYAKGSCAGNWGEARRSGGCCKFKRFFK